MPIYLPIRRFGQTAEFNTGRLGASRAGAMSSLTSRKHLDASALEAGLARGADRVAGGYQVLDADVVAADQSAGAVGVHVTKLAVTSFLVGARREQVEGQRPSRCHQQELAFGSFFQNSPRRRNEGRSVTLLPCPAALSLEVSTPAKKGQSVNRTTRRMYTV